MNFLVAIHVLIAFALIALVLVQDSKGGGALGIGAGSNSLLGATGAQTLYARLTRWVAALFGISCIALSVWIASGNSSVIDATPAPAAQAKPVSPAAPSPGTAPVDAKPDSAAAPENNSPPATK